MTEATGHLETIGASTYVWRQEPSGHGRCNAGVIVDDDGLTVVDALLTPAQSTSMLEALAPFERPPRRVIYTSSHAELTGGSSSLWMAARYGRPQTSALLDQPPNLEVLRRLFPDDADAFDDGFATRPVSHTIDTAAWLTPSVCAVPVAGEQLENLVALVPGDDVVFAGALACFGTTPNAFDGDPGRWADTLGELGELASTVVPGIGPVGGADDLLSLQAYLYACVDAEGDASAIPEGPWDAWTDRHLDAVNVERAAMLAAGDTAVPPSMLRLVGLA